VKDESQLEAVADNTLNALNNLGKFLSQDNSFSNYDRATALTHYADSSRETIADVCKRKQFQDCPTGGIDQYRKNTADASGIDAEKVRVGAWAIAMQVKYAKLAKSKPNPAAVVYANALPVTAWETFVRRHPEITEHAAGESFVPVFFWDISSNPDKYQADLAALVRSHPSMFRPREGARCGSLRSGLAGADHMT
jgi:hypothetical protein